MRLDLFVKLMYESITIIFFVGIRHSVCELYFLTRKLCLTRKLAISYASETVSDVSASCRISSP